MSETEATYKLEHPEWAHSEFAERLPECETGSLERMLRSAIVWHGRIWARIENNHALSQTEQQLLRSQEALLYNVLSQLPQMTPKERFWFAEQHENATECPCCKTELTMQWFLKPPTDG